MPKPLVVTHSSVTQRISADGAKVFPTAQELADYCAAEITSGRLVAFPTETVYGLGADGLNPAAVDMIFKVKGRPKSDPCILHVAESADALPLYDLTHKETVVITKLTEVFWPGPLSIVAKAAPHVPTVTMGGGDQVALRMPRAELIRMIIKKAGTPIAGPSANKFGRISPTNPQHVHDAFFEDDIAIIDDGAQSSVGIESTVLRVAEIDGLVHLTILRRGAVRGPDLQSLSYGTAAEPVPVIVTYNDNEIEEVLKGETGGREVFSEGSKSLTPVTEEIQKAAEAYDAEFETKGVSSASPGSCITHYAPRTPCILVRLIEQTDPPIPPCHLLPALESAVLIQIDKSLDWDVHRAVAIQGAEIEGALMRECFGLLHRAEACAKDCDSDVILIPLPESHDAILEASYDRLYRAASGKVCTLVVKSRRDGKILPQYLALL